MRVGCSGFADRERQRRDHPERFNFGIWTIQTSIFPENVASVELHKRCDFRVVGTRERIAQLDGAWRDTVLLERRRPEE